MKQYNAKNIRNVVLLGHSSSGKTSLAEAAYYLSGASDRLGKVADGNTVSDFDPEEIKRGASVSTSIIPLEWKDCKINLLDTPGLFDFSDGVSEGVRAADSAVILLSAKSGVAVGTEKGYLAASKKGIAKIFFVNEMDNEHADYYKVFGELKENFGAGVCPIVVPYVENHVVKCYVNLIENKAYTYNAKGVATEVPVPSFSHVDELRDAINEAVAETSEELMEKYFGGEEFTQEELVNGLSQGVHNGEISPIFCGSATTLEGVDQLINGLTWLAPSADIAAHEVATAADGSKVELKTDENEKTVIVVFKSIDDQFGKLQYFKVVSGKVTPDSVLINSRTGASEKFSKLLYITGKKQENAECIPAGDIGAVSKLNSTNTGDTLADGKQGLTLPGVNYELSGLSMAIFPANKGDEEKIFAGLARIHEEDPTISYYTNAETRETIVSGMGEQHLDLVVS
ncbi:MAG: elongation factor G, partial [Clostridia bacterium]|nr:elongation factor G [Clostridia bacterium]